MAKVLKNYKPSTKEFEGYPSISIRYDDEVFLELPLCAIDYGRIYKEPYLMYEQNKIPSVIEKEELKKLLEGTKIFYFKIQDNMKLKEVKQEEADISTRLPIDTKTEELVFMDGQILKEEIQEVIEDGNV